MRKSTKEAHAAKLLYNQKYRTQHKLRLNALATIRMTKHRQTPIGKAQQHAASRECYKKKRVFLVEFKNRPCMDCGIFYPPYVMEFDHVRGKKVNGVGRMLTNSMVRLVAEIAKCDLVCANCHRERTFTRKGYRSDL